MKNIGILLFFLIFLFSCKTVKNVTPPVDSNAPVDNTEFFTKIKEPSNFQQVKMNSKINIQSENFIPTLDATIYIENQQKIWMNFSALLFNVGRGLATNNGIKGYEKWNKTYIDSDFSYLNTLLNVNFIDFEALQNLLIGKTFLPVNAADYTLTKNAQGYTVTSKKNQTFTKGTKTSAYSVILNYSENADLNKILLEDQTNGDKLEVSYTNWISQNNMRLPKNVKIIINSQKNSLITFENTTFAFDKMETPYTVPANYTKTEIR